MPVPLVGVMTVDDREVFRQAAKEVIDATLGFEYLGEATCCETALVLAGRAPSRPRPARRAHAGDRRARNRTPAERLASGLDDRARLDGEPRRARPRLASCGAAAFVLKEEFGPAMLRRLRADHGCHGVSGSTD